MDSIIEILIQFKWFLYVLKDFYGEFWQLIRSSSLWIPVVLTVFAFHFLSKKKDESRRCTFSVKGSLYKLSSCSHITELIIGNYYYDLKNYLQKNGECIHGKIKEISITNKENGSMYILDNASPIHLAICMDAPEILDLMLKMSPKYGKLKKYTFLTNDDKFLCCENISLYNLAVLSKSTSVLQYLVQNQNLCHELLTFHNCTIRKLPWAAVPDDLKAYKYSPLELATIIGDHEIAMMIIELEGNTFTENSMPDEVQTLATVEIDIFFKEVQQKLHQKEDKIKNAIKLTQQIVSAKKCARGLRNNRKITEYSDDDFIKVASKLIGDDAPPHIQYIYHDRETDAIIIRVDSGQMQKVENCLQSEFPLLFDKGQLKVVEGKPSAQLLMEKSDLLTLTGGERYTEHPRYLTRLGPGCFLATVHGTDISQVIQDQNIRLIEHLNGKFPHKSCGSLTCFAKEACTGEIFGITAMHVLDDKLDKHENNQVFILTEVHIDQHEEVKLKVEDIVLLSSNYTGFLGRSPVDNYTAVDIAIMPLSQTALAGHNLESLFTFPLKIVDKSSYSQFIGKKVEKHGALTGKRYGRLVGKVFTRILPEPYHPRCSSNMGQMFVVKNDSGDETPFAVKGDSGSLVLYRDEEAGDVYALGIVNQYIDDDDIQDSFLCVYMKNCLDVTGKDLTIYEDFLPPLLTLHNRFSPDQKDLGQRQTAA